MKKHGDFRRGIDSLCNVLDSLAKFKLLNYALKSSPALVAALAVTSLLALNPPRALAQSAPDCPAIKATLLKPSTISEAEVLAAQKGWGDALVAISTTYDKNEKDGKYDQTPCVSKVVHSV